MPDNIFKTEVDLTTGNIPKTLLMFAIPFIVANFLQALYGACDLIIIGHFLSSSGAISSVAIGAQIMHLVMAFIIGLTTGTTVLIGQDYGAKRNDEIEKTTGTVLLFFLGLSFVVFVLMFLFSKNLIEIMQTPKEAFFGALQYVKICSFGIIFIFLFNSFSSILRGVGNS